jgi:hypothetical protein
MKATFTFIFTFFAISSLFAQADYTTTVTFPANYQVGDYIEFLRVAPQDAGASGYYEISISYTRNSVAAAATHLASISHANPAVWREVGRLNGNPYINAGVYNFTIDCNTEYANPRFRIRAIGTFGWPEPITVNIKVRSISLNSYWTALNASGNDLTVTKFLPMTNEWNLYVGNDITSNGANLAIKAIENGNVGIGTSTPDAKLTVNGTLHSKEVRVDMNILPDYVFKPGYDLLTLDEVKRYIDKNQHLPGVPSAEQTEKGGLKLGEMNAILLKKVEELTLYLLERDKQLKSDRKDISELKKQVKKLNLQNHLIWVK